MSTYNINTPAYIATSNINFDGVPGTRLFVAYRTIGCAYDKRGTGCTMCNFAEYADPRITGENLEKQHETALVLLSSGIQHFDFATLGNFYHDREIPHATRLKLLGSLRELPKLKRVLTESRRQYVSVEKLQEAKACLRPDQTLEFALGYETINPHIRTSVLNKATPEKHLDQCLEICRDARVNFVGYTLIKPPSLTEAEAIDDAVATALHVLNKAASYGVNARIAFEPVFVTHGKPIETLWRRGEYQSPKLWSIAEVLIRTGEQLGLENTQGKLFVGLSDEGLSDGRTASNCGVCDSEITAAIQDFNGHQDIEPLKQLNHGCKEDWLEEVGVGRK